MRLICHPFAVVVGRFPAGLTIQLLISGSLLVRIGLAWEVGGERIEIRGPQCRGGSSPPLGTNESIVYKMCFARVRYTIWRW